MRRLKFVRAITINPVASLTAALTWQPVMAIGDNKRLPPSPWTTTVAEDLRALRKHMIEHPSEDKDENVNEDEKAEKDQEDEDRDEDDKENESDCDTIDDGTHIKQRGVRWRLCGRQYLKRWR